MGKCSYSYYNFYLLSYCSLSGYAFLKTVSASHCKLCDKQLINKEELSDHMKTREHYELFAADVANRREKVAASEAKKVSEWS